MRTDTLMGDSATRTAKTRLQSILSSEVSDLSEPYAALSRIGVKTASDGTMSLDSAAFRAAMADAPDAVGELFWHTDGDDATDNDGVAVSLARAIDAMLQSSDGLLVSHQAGLDRRIDDIDQRIGEMERNLETYEAGLQRQFAALEQLLSGLQSQSSFLAAQIGG